MVSSGIPEDTGQSHLVAHKPWGLPAQPQPRFSAPFPVSPSWTRYVLRRRLCTPCAAPTPTCCRC